MAIVPKHIGKVGFKKKERQFTDRENFIETFRNYLSLPIDPNQYKVLVFYGVGGVGKTTLRKHLSKILESEFPSTIYTSIDLDVPLYRNMETTLFVLRNELTERYKIRFPSFDVAYTAFWHKTHPQVPITKDNFPLLTGASVVAGIMRVLGEMPWVGWIPKLSKAFLTGSNVFREWWKKRGERELADIPELEAKEIAERLPFFWASDLEDYLSQKQTKATIFFDTYEALWENANTEGGFFLRDEWVRDLVSYLPQVLWVICGREKLRWEEIDIGWRKYLSQHLVGELSEADSKKFLSSCGVNDKDIQDVIYQASKGLPHFLDLAIDTYNEIGNKLGRIPTVNDFARTQQDVLDRFLRYLDRSEIETLKVISAPRLWNYELAQKLIEHFNTAYPLTAINNLCRFSFIKESNTENFYTMHELMRESIQAKLDKNTLRSLHKFIFNFYNNKLWQVDIRFITDDVRRSMNEAYYHAKTALTYEEFYEWIKIIGKKFFDAAEWKLITPLMEDFLKITEEKKGTLTLEYADVMYQLGKLYQMQGKYSVAEKTYTKTLEIRTRVLGEMHIDTAAVLSALGVLYTNKGLLLEAKSKFQKALEINRKLLGDNNEYVANILNNLAAINEDLGDLNNAEMLYNDAINLYEKFQRTNTSYAANAYNNLAILYVKKNQPEKAEELFRKALTIRETIFGANHPDYINSLHNLASYYNFIGKYEEAKKLYKKVYRLKLSIYGEEHPEVAATFVGIAELYDNLNLKEKAIQYYQKALNIYLRIYGENHPNVKNIQEIIKEF
ncbi:MAG: tetratricopeptide repeat protein [Ignavibacteria bacterium]